MIFIPLAAVLSDVTIMASASCSRSIMAIAASASMAMQAVARASAVMASGAITVAEMVVLFTGRHVSGSIVWPMRPPGVSR